MTPIIIVIGASTTGTFAQLLEEFYARGFSYLNEDSAGRTRAERWLNEAYLEDICAAYPWDFLRTSQSGTAPLTITDLDQVISVVDSTAENPLQRLDVKTLIDYGDANLDEVGSAAHWYMSDETTLAVHPADTTSTFVVRYWKIPAEMTAAEDEPIVPSRWRGLLVDGAVIRGYRDSDNWDAANQLQAHFDRRLMQMASSEMVRSQEPDFIVITDE